MGAQNCANRVSEYTRSFRSSSARAESESVINAHNAMGFPLEASTISRAGSSIDTRDYTMSYVFAADGITVREANVISGISTQTSSRGTTYFFNEQGWLTSVGTVSGTLSTYVYSGELVMR